MSYRELEMVEIKEVLLRLAHRERKRAISRALGVHRRTINRYLKLCRVLGVEPCRDGAESITDGLVEKIREKDKQHDCILHTPTALLLLPLETRIEEQVESGLKGSKIFQLVRRDGVCVSEASFYRFLRTHCSAWLRSKVTVRLPETQPGDYAQCDFGRLGKVFDEESKRTRVVYAFIMTLCFSRHQYAYVSFRQDLETVIKGCEAGFRYFGGVPARLIFDNLKPVINDADRYTPVINAGFLEYAQFRGFIVDPCVPGHAKGKPQVERAVSYLRGNFFTGETFLNLADLQSRLSDWCTNTAGRRLHRTTYQIPLEVFETIENKHLLPFEDKRYDIPTYAECKVHPDHHISFCKSLYSVPTQYLGKKVLVRGDSILVRIYHNGKVVKVHNRMPAGKRSTDFKDYPSELTPYVTRSPEYQIQEGFKKDPAIGKYIETMLSGSYPWHRLRTAQKILRLPDKYGIRNVALACERFQMYGVFDVGRLERMLQKGLSQLSPKQPLQLKLPISTKPPRFEREASSFNHYKHQ